MIGFRPAITPNMPIVYSLIVTRSANRDRLGALFMAFRLHGAKTDLSRAAPVLGACLGETS